MLKFKALQSLLHCLEGSLNTSVSSGWKNLNYESLAGELLPIPHQLGNYSVMLKRGSLCKTAAENISTCQFIPYSISLVHSFSQCSICRYFGPKIFFNIINGYIRFLFLMKFLYLQYSSI